MDGLFAALVVLFGIGYGFGYWSEKPKHDDSLTAFQIRAQEATVPAAYFTVADLQAFETPGEYGRPLAKGYWAGVHDALAILASAERVGNDGKCCTAYGPLAYLSVDAFIRDGLGPTVDRLAETVVATPRGRDRGAAELLFSAGAKDVKHFSETWPVLLDSVKPGRQTRSKASGPAVPVFRTMGAAQKELVERLAAQSVRDSQLPDCLGEE